MNCKVCKEPAIVRVSKSQKNLGKEFYACPKSCQGWIGWVDESLNATKEQKAFVKKPPATPMPNTKFNENYINEDGEVGCKACGKTCMLKISSSEKNHGKEYYACQDMCNIWNGWADDIIKEPNSNNDNTVKQVKPQTTPHTRSKTDSKKKIFNMLAEEF